MSEANKGEAEKCKQIAMTAYSTGDCEKAARFLQKAKRMCPDDASVDALLEKVAAGPPADATPVGGGASAASEADGPRFRTSSSASSSAGRATPQAGTRTDKAGRTYTTEQMQLVQRIMRTKDYYDIVDVPKNSSEDAVKKAYKKLALKLHPDKNKAPGAEEAFKKVARAVQCLTDPKQKQMYDRYGDEERIPQHHRRHQGHGQQDFMTPEDLFNAFFGGGAFNTQHQQGGHGGGEANVQAQRAQLFQMLPIILLVLLSLLSNFAGRDAGGRFSFQPNGQYQNERTSSQLKVPYYVGTDFEERYGEGTRAMTDFEKQVEVYFVRNLHSECDYQEKVMYKKVMLANRRGSQDELEKARKHPKPACNDLEKIKKKHMPIYRSALYTGY